MTSMLGNYAVSAFPHSQPLNPYSQHGMTLRDYFAGQALVGLIARSGPGRLPEDEQLAGTAYYIAIAMLDAREQSQ
jgi:hypothetical protein